MLSSPNFDKGAEAIQWGKDSLFQQTIPEQLDFYRRKRRKKRKKEEKKEQEEEEKERKEEEREEENHLSLHLTSYRKN